MADPPIRVRHPWAEPTRGGGGPWQERPFGSNQWALAPARTAAGHALLLINPHQSFVGVQRYAEIHIHSGQGLVFSGLTVFGFLLPYMGHNQHLGWAYTDNYADHSDLYAETFPDSLHYRYGGELRTAGGVHERPWSVLRVYQVS